jgi:hypothetical protein
VASLGQLCVVLALTGTLHIETMEGTQMIVHHAPLDIGPSWNLHAWQLAWDGNSVWDPTGSVNSGLIDFQFPAVADPRKLRFKYRSTSTTSGASIWEPDTCVRQVVQTTPAELWTFIQSPRILYQSPTLPGLAFHPGDVLTVLAITKHRYAGGLIYVWNPYNPANPSAYFPQTARDDAAGISSFAITLETWMMNGFHFKLTGWDTSGVQIWEQDTSNRVWRPCDGASLWIKSGQCDVRSQPLTLTQIDLEVLLPATLSPPQHSHCRTSLKICNCQ